jgi:DNA-binding transcriptional LysR family regulator
MPRLATFDIDLLRSFLMVQQAGGFSQAAQLLQCTQLCSSSTMAGVRASVQPGLAIAVMGHSEVTQDLRVIAGEGGLPKLTAADIMIFHRDRGLQAAAQSLTGHIRQAVC